jgi:hypothetical protein
MLAQAAESPCQELPARRILGDRVARSADAAARRIGLSNDGVRNERAQFFPTSRTDADGIACIHSATLRHWMRLWKLCGGAVVQSEIMANESAV